MAKKKAVKRWHAVSKEGRVSCYGGETKADLIDNYRVSFKHGLARAQLFILTPAPKPRPATPAKKPATKGKQR